MPSTSRLRHSPWIIWSIGAGVYFLGFIHRASLGVAGPAAVARLDITSTQLGSFIMVQLGLYAVMQVPSGMAIDKWGARRVLLAATLAMGSAQVMFAFATSYPLALLARALLGVGDAAVFIAVLRLAATHFERRRYAVLTTFTALAGMVGNFVATLPLVLALNAWGWGRTFFISGAISIAYALLLLRPAVRNPVDPPSPAGFSAAPPAVGLAEVRAVWSRPEVRLGFWTHLATLHAALVLSLLWGFPYLTEALGYSEAAAASVLSLYIGASLVSSFFMGPIAGRHPRARLAMAFFVALAVTLSLATLVFWPWGTPPSILVGLVFIIAAIGGPTSQIGFHLARDYNPAGSISTATGLVNAGGFVGAMIASISIGAVLDGLGETTLWSYRWALGTLVGVSALATLTMTVSMLGVRRRVIARMDAGEDVIVAVYPRAWDRAYAALTGKR